MTDDEVGAVVVESPASAGIRCRVVERDRRGRLRQERLLRRCAQLRRRVVVKLYHGVHRQPQLSQAVAEFNDRGCRLLGREDGARRPWRTLPQQPRSGRHQGRC